MGKGLPGMTYRKIKRGGGNIGKLLIMEFADNESMVFDNMMNMLQKYPNFRKYALKDEVILSLPGLEIRPKHRKVYSKTKEISLTKKEFDIFYLLAVNKGRVVTYEQIYQNVWNGYSTGRERSHYISHMEYKEKVGWDSFLIYTVCKGTGILYGSGNRRITTNHITVWVKPGCFSYV